MSLVLCSVLLEISLILISLAQMRSNMAPRYLPHTKNTQHNTTQRQSALKPKQHATAVVPRAIARFPEKAEPPLGARRCGGGAGSSRQLTAGPLEPHSGGGGARPPHEGGRGLGWLGTALALWGGLGALSHGGESAVSTLLMLRMNCVLVILRSSRMEVLKWSVFNMMTENARQ